MTTTWDSEDLQALERAEYQRRRESILDVLEMAFEQVAYLKAENTKLEARVKALDEGALPRRQRIKELEDAIERIDRIAFDAPSEMAIGELVHRIRAAAAGCDQEA